jgi:hypothetical protein
MAQPLLLKPRFLITRPARLSYCGAGTYPLSAIKEAIAHAQRGERSFWMLPDHPPDLGVRFFMESIAGLGQCGSELRAAIDGDDVAGDPAGLVGRDDVADHVEHKHQRRLGPRVSTGQDRMIERCYPWRLVRM